MLFASYEFAAFLAVTFVLYYLLPKRYQWILLLAASYFFYFCADPRYLGYIVVTSASTYLIGIQIARVKSRQSQTLEQKKGTISREEKKAYKAFMKKKTFRWLLVCLLLNLGILAVVKYGNFTIHNLNNLLHLAGSATSLGFINVVVPMGISFYTFQAVSYIIDVYRGTVEAERNPFRFALFVSFFPQLVQGPISRFGDLSKTLFCEHSFDREQILRGFERILWGYFKKLVIADRVLIGVNTIINDPESYGGAWVFVGMLFYALELYADFTGGIDITIGVAQIFGVEIKENFRRPYFSKSIKEYWKRWHITMGTWFTDYIFYPISVSRPMLKLSKFCRSHLGEAPGKRVPVYLSSLAVWLATGIWHGASWNFVAWGLGNYVVIMISQELEPLYAKFHDRFNVSGNFFYRLFTVVRTVLLMSCLRLFDCYRDVPLTFRMFGSMLVGGNWNILWNGELLGIGLTLLDYVILALGLVILVSVSLVQRKGSVRTQIAALPGWARFIIWYGLLLAVLLAGMYGTGYDATQFIYNQF